MSKINKNYIQEKFKDTKQATDKALTKLSDIKLRPKIDAALEIRSDARNKRLFAADVHVDKEFSLLKLIRNILLVIAFIELVRTGFELLCMCGKDDAEDCE